MKHHLSLKCTESTKEEFLSFDNHLAMKDEDLNKNFLWTNCKDGV